MKRVDLLKKEIARNGVPIGSVHYFATAEPPRGYLKADGSSVNRTTYRELFDVIGTVSGEGDGETTFNLPDLRGEFVRGFDDGRGADPDRAFGSWQVTTAFMGDGDGYNVPLVNLNNATHKQILGFDFDVAPVNATPVNLPWVDAAYSAAGAAVTGTHAFGSASISVDFARSRPRNVALLACIKAFDAPPESV